MLLKPSPSTSRYLAQHLHAAPRRFLVEHVPLARMQLAAPTRAMGVQIFRARGLFSDRRCYCKCWACGCRSGLLDRLICPLIAESDRGFKFTDHESATSEPQSHLPPLLWTMPIENYFCTKPLLPRAEVHGRLLQCFLWQMPKPTPPRSLLNCFQLSGLVARLLDNGIPTRRYRYRSCIFPADVH